MGTVIGSSIFNILGIMGAAALVSPRPIMVPAGMLLLDLPVMLGTALVLAVLVTRQRAIGRVTGIVLASGYATYLAALVSIA